MYAGGGHRSDSVNSLFLLLSCYTDDVHHLTCDHAAINHIQYKCRSLLTRLFHPIPPYPSDDALYGMWWINSLRWQIRSRSVFLSLNLTSPWHTSPWHFERSRYTCVEPVDVNLWKELKYVSTTMYECIWKDWNAESWQRSHVISVFHSLLRMLPCCRLL